MNAEELFNILKPIRVGGSVCRYSLSKCRELIPVVNEIIELKKKRNAVILAHSYVSPDILYTVADYIGDSYKLSQVAKERKEEIIIFVAVKFMAETAKILNPTKDVYIASKFNGCSLADSITEEDIQELKKKYPRHTFVCYINTTAVVKAYCDVCVTSSNVYDIIEAIENDKIYFLPDKLMGMNIVQEMRRRGSSKEIIYYEDGTCYVHEEYDPDMVDYLKMEYENLDILAHPECSPEILEKSDYVGSTEGLLNYIKEKEGKEKEGNYLLLTECGLSDRVSEEIRGANLVGSCTQCKYMKSNQLVEIARILRDLPFHNKIELPLNIEDRARVCIQKMFEYTQKKV